MAIKANFFRNARRLSVFGDNADVASRDAAGNILLQ